ncbi:SiaB family protein kinase [Clostridiaceae bacterium 35-E11]
MNNNLMEMKNMLSNNGILIIFSGRFSQGIIEELGDALKNHLESEETPKNEIYNVFSVFIEQTQNIKNYTYTKKDSPNYDRMLNSGVVCIGRSNDGYYVLSGNFVENKDLQKLTDYIDTIASLDKTALKKLYKEQLKKEISPDSLGAGLGLIDMARKSISPISYFVNKIDDDLSFFELKVIV